MGATPPLGGAGAVSEIDRELEGQPFEKNMMEECRSVDEYEKLNRISGGCVFEEVPL